jgi:serine/threonine protein phosphatase PrpC
MAGGAAAAAALVAAVGARVKDPAAEMTNAMAWVRLLTDTDKKLAAIQAGETTAVVVVITATGVLGASSGDSEAWIIHQDDIDELTVGQTKQRIGGGRAGPVAFYRPPFRGVLVVATDGLFKYAPRDKVVVATRRGTAAERAERLRALVQLESGAYPDDVAVVVVRAR